MTKKADIDYIISWHGFGHSHKKSESWYSYCRLRIWKQKPIIVLFSDLNEVGTGSSITGCSENLANIVQFHFQLLEPIRWFEHYPHHNIPLSNKKELMFTQSISEVSYIHNEEYRHPHWKPFDRGSLEKLVNSSISMTDYKTVKKLQLQTLWEHNQDEFARGSRRRIV